jgi:serine/threonine protein kinase
MHEAPLIPDGTTIAGRFDIVRAVGRGAFGRTYLAHDRLHGREVALKLLDPRGTAEWKARELFEREATVLRGLRHQGVPEIVDATDVEWQGRRSPMLVLEYVAGASLADIIDAGHSMDSADVLRLLLELLGVVEYLHGRVPPVLHRDIKPANVIVRGDGTPVLVDFGAVRQIFLEASEEGSTVAGTYGYMPYEQYMGQASPASDLFALGATFLHL